MIVQIAVVVAALATFGIFLCMISIAVISNQRENLDETRRLVAEFELINARLQHQRERGRR